jgi:hypothetical protein
MMTVSEDYKSGFKDGFAAGLEEGKKLQPLKTDDLPINFGPVSCSRCGRNTATAIVCYNSNCPTSYSGKAKSPDKTGWIIR